MIKVEVQGKTRIVRKSQIHYQTDDDLQCTYRNHLIDIAAQETGGFYCTVSAPDGCCIVQGGFGGPHCKYNITSITDCLVMCIDNIID